MMGMMGMMTPEMMQLQMTTQMMQMMTQVRLVCTPIFVSTPTLVSISIVDVHPEFGIRRHDDE
jgi:hypothetical protein